MTKPAISEATKLLLQNAKQFEALKQQAAEETAEYLQWLYSEAYQRLSPILGPDAKLLVTKYGAYVGLPNWSVGAVQIGISCGVGSDPRQRLISDHAEPPYVGVGIVLLDGSYSKSDCQPISDMLHPLLSRVWSHAADLADPTYEYPLWRYLPIPADGDLDRWSTGVIVLMEEMAKELAPVLTKALAQPSKLKS
jgi:hypothetical protein